MKRRLFVLSVVALVVIGLVVGAAFAAAPKTYQVTGPVVSVTADTITVAPVKYPGEKWEIGRDASTKMTGDPKVGDKVTIVYRMTAASIEVKPAKGK